jgi:hypothetical protein
MHQEVFTVGNEKVVNRIFDNWYHSPRRDAKGNWYKRGWTYQEDVFSRRRIVFEGDSVRWQCFHCSWYEDILIDQKRTRDDYNKLFAQPYPDMVSYGYMASAYNWRQLTYDGDTLFAFAGVTSALSQTFQGGFLCGLAELFFDNAILWDYSGESKRKRIPSSTRGIPTWSWSGWSMNWRDSHHEWDSKCEYIRTSTNPSYPMGYEVVPDHHLTPILQWYSSDNPSGEGRRPIASRGYM